MRESYLWSFVEEVKQCIPVPPLELIFPLLRRWHTIHIVHGGSSLQPLTPEELSLIKEIMSGKFSYPSAKEARWLKTSDNKRKRPLVDTSIINDCVTAKSIVTPRSAEPSLDKSSRKTKLDEPQDFVYVHLPLDGSAYSDPSFIKGVADNLLLPSDRKRFIKICPM